MKIKILMNSSRTIRKSSPLLELNAPGTFSQTMYLGRIAIPALPLCTSASLNSFTHRICSMKRPERSSASPFFLSRLAQALAWAASCHHVHRFNG